MKNILSLACATMMAGASFSAASAASLEEMTMSMKDKMSCSASCSTEYNQCVADKSDYSLSAENLMERTKMNMMAPLDCSAANRECNSAC